MALVGVIVLSALLMTLALTLAVAVRSDTQLRGAFASGVTGFYAAESGLNAGMGEYRNIFLDYNVPNGSDFSPRTMTVGSREVTYKLSERAGNPQNVVIPQGELFAGLNAQQYRYIVNSQAMNQNTDIEAGVGAEFLVGYIPLFQFVAFYKNDLEIAPGPEMNLEGRVHTNGDLYLSANSGPLRVRDNPATGVTSVQVSAGKKIYRGRKYTNTCDGGSQVWVDKLEDVVAPFGNNDEKELLCGGANRREIPVAELALWRGSLLNNLGNIAVPEPDIIKPPTSISNGGAADPGVYWDKADLRIVLTIGQQGRLAAVVNPGALPVPFLPYLIQAFKKDGTDVSNTLYNFMSDGAWNSGNIPGSGPSTYRGTMPIFVTDIPVAGGCTLTQWNCNNHLIASYAPTIGTGIGGVPFPNFRPNTGINSFAYNEQMGQGNPLGGPFTFDLDYRRGGFYNRREGMWMILLNINVRDLILWNQQNGEPFFSKSDNSEGGIVIFATVAGPNSNSASNNYGVRVFGSADLPCPGAGACGIGQIADPTGVTVVSDQAMYVLGNFNRGTAAGGPARQPASMVGDSVNVLSERYWRGQALCNDRWCRDGQSAAGLDQASRDAATTWINAAFLGGVDTTPLDGGTQSVYNGGLENYPRFHEDWGGAPQPQLNYQGSFVSLGTPEHVDGAWCGTGGTNASGCNIYNPPARFWNFDPGYNNAANLPPLTPRFVYVQQVLFTEDFK
jgi:hypothetical protein